MTTVEDILKNSHTVAIVGLSSNPERPSYIVGQYLKEHGYKVVPVNPTEKTILRLKSYPDLHSIPFKVDVVDIFRKPGDVPPIVRDAIKIGAKAVWMQEGIKNEEASAAARKAGLKVVQNKCMRKQHIRLFSGK
ncbi:MAG: CoA-binding protein [Chloroflexi bacterium RBG_13_57_8]|nr:MAG: CoA-binding protein [Chloroflexi bacterium RBG_13_57_8]